MAFRNRYKQMLETELQRFSSDGDDVMGIGVTDFSDLPVSQDEKPVVPEQMSDTIQSLKI